MANDTQNYIVIGGTGGIGSAVCRMLAHKGANLFLVARNAEKLKASAEKIRQDFGINIEYQGGDMTRPDEVKAVFSKALEMYPQIHGVTHLVGSILLKPIHLMSDDEFEETLTINARSAFYVTRSAIESMMKTGGSIVLASTVATLVGLMNHDAIAMAKSAINGLVRSAAATYAPKHIRVNAVAPGLVDTPLAEKITSSENALKISQSMHPLGRIGQPDDVATAITWLLTPESSWVTGQIISVDGGMSTVRPR